LHIVRVKIVSWQNKKVANLGLQYSNFLLHIAQ